ncbi:glycosyltransferase [Empedobacter falsenii]
MNQPLVSINIPVFKCEDYVLRCLESVKAQTYTNIETILVNDCTPDNSVEIIEKFIHENSQLKMRLVHLDKNSGLSVVRNRGIDSSNGKYLFFLDSDDEITKDCIELLVKKAEEEQVQMVIAQNKWINTFDNTTKDYGFPTLAKKNLYQSNDEIFREYCFNKFPIVSWNKLFQLDFIKSNKIYFVPKLFAQDELWFFHVMFKIDSLAIIPEITYLYYLHKNSVIFNRTKINFENHQTILEWFTKSYHQTKNADRKKWIRKKIVNFKDLTMIMQYKFMRDDVTYWKQNYRRTQKAPGLKLSDYLTNDFNKKEKKANILYNLPAEIGYRLFKKRYNG